MSLLLVPGRKDRIDSDGRLSAFVTGVTKRLHDNPGGNVKLREQRIDYCHWRRDNARIRVGAFFEAHEIPHVIFAANDHMCLGARDALDHFRQKHNQPIEAGSVELYGFDRIDDMVQRLDEEDEPFIRGTVGQKVSEIANSLRGMVVQILKRQPAITPAPASTEIKTWVRFNDPVSTLSAVVRPYRKEESDLWESENKAVERTGVKSLRAKRTELKYKGSENPAEGKQTRLEGVDKQGQWWIDEDGRHSRRVKTLGVIYLIRTLKPKRTIET